MSLNAAIAKRPLRVHKPDTFHDGRDEMNLVEFPFATLSERSGDARVLEFQVETYDRIVGKPVIRKLTVTGDLKYGLPTAKDEEVYLGLLQLTKLRNDFSDARVYFTRSELIKLMGWKNRDWSYQRMATAFCRLTGVRLFYENAWRDNAKKRFRSQGGFGLLDSFEIRDGRIRSSNNDSEDRLSEFRWNSVIFASFQSGYLKKLDYAKVRGLSTTARRVYRYLDKHFHPPHRTTLIMNLKEFALEHIGISRKHDTAQIRRALSQPLQELVALGFLAPDKRRYLPVKGRRGEWEVRLTLAGQLPIRAAKQPASSRTPVIPIDHAIPDRLDRYLASLSDAERTEVEAVALRQASGFLRDTLEAKQDGPLADECRKQIVKAYLSKSMRKQSAA
jgi:hypothetical protein